MAVVDHDARRTDAHRNPQRQIRRRDLQRTQPRAILRDPRGRRHARRARRPDRIGLGEPLAQLPLEIGAVEEAPLLEERAFDPADEILDAAFLLRPIRPAHLDADAEIERHAGKRRIPLRDHAVASPLERDRLRSIKHGDQGNAAEGGEMLDQRADQRFDALIGHQRDLDPPRVLQAARRRSAPSSRCRPDT